MLNFKFINDHVRNTKRHKIVYAEPHEKKIENYIIVLKLHSFIITYKILTTKLVTSFILYKLVLIFFIKIMFVTCTFRCNKQMDEKEGFTF